MKRITVSEMERVQVADSWTGTKPRGKVDCSSVWGHVSQGNLGEPFETAPPLTLRILWLPSHTAVTSALNVRCLKLLKGGEEKKKSNHQFAEFNYGPWQKRENDRSRRTFLPLVQSEIPQNPIMCDNETHSLPDLFNQHNCLRTLLIIAVVFRHVCLWRHTNAWGNS